MSLNLSIVINTCAGLTVPQTGWQGQIMQWRAYALRNWIIPAYADLCDDLIVVGEWEDGPGYTYCELPKQFGARDVLQQRQLGYELAKHDVILFQADDHFVSPLGAIEPVMEHLSLNILMPRRRTRLRSPYWEPLNNGEHPPQYLPFHAGVYRRHVLDACPWKDIPRREDLDWEGKTELDTGYDVEHTRQLKKHDFRVAWVDDVIAWDIEYGARPWD